MIADTSPVIIPGELELSVGDTIGSPSGVYYATLLNNGKFVVSQGTNQPTSGLNAVWESLLIPGLAAVNPIAILSDGIGVVRVDGEDSNIISYFGALDTGSPGMVVSLADNGALTLATGTDPAHPIAQTFTDNVNDPVVAYDLTGVTYDLAHAKITSTSQVAGEVYNAKNGGPGPQVFPASLTLKYIKASNWTFSVSAALTLGVKTAFDVGIPGIGDSETELSISETTTIGRAEGGSDSEERDFSAGVDITVPGDSFYQAVLTATRETFDVPFTYTGVAQYQDGATANVNGSGMFTGTDTGIFETDISCISTPGGCPLAPPPAPVPEPSTWSLMSGGALVLAALRRLMARRARAPV